MQLTSYAIFLSASAFFLWMFTLLMNRYKYRLSGREWALYLLFPVSQCLLLYGWMMLCRLDFSANRMWILLAGLVTCVAADAALFTAVRGMAQRVELPGGKRPAGPADRPPEGALRGHYGPV